MIVRRIVGCFLLVLLFAAVSVTFAQDGGEPSRGPQQIDVFTQYIIKGGVITWFILIPLSVAMVALAIEHFISIRKANILPDEVTAQVLGHIESKQYQQAKTLTASEPSFFSYTINAALNEAPNGFAAMERALEEASEERTTKLFRKIEFLNLIGNVAPMIGLFGTVSGMIVAFNDIRGAANIADSAADGIGTALVTTFWGLMIAIPALTVYAIIRNKIDALSAEATLRADEMLGLMRRQYKEAQDKKKV